LSSGQLLHHQNPIYHHHSVVLKLSAVYQSLVGSLTKLHHLHRQCSQPLEKFLEQFVSDDEHMWMEPCMSEELRCNMNQKLLSWVSECLVSFSVSAMEPNRKSKKTFFIE